MSLSEGRAVACPQCNAVSTMNVRLSVNAVLDPGAKDELLNGRLFVFTCASCGREARIVDPHFVYSDAKKGLLLQLDTLGDFDRGAALAAFGAGLPPTTRIVREGNALLEKVKIFDAGLDDRVVEALKLLARSMQPPGRVGRYLFEAVEGQGDAAKLRFTLLSQDGTVTALAAPLEMYAGLMRKLEGDGRLVDPGPFAVVDDAFANVLLSG